VQRMSDYNPKQSKVFQNYMCVLWDWSSCSFPTKRRQTGLLQRLLYEIFQK